MKVICTRNNAEFELVSKDGDDITLKDLNSGKERIVNRKSYERFYKEVEEEVVEEVEDLEEEETEEVVDQTTELLTQALTEIQTLRAENEELKAKVEALETDFLNS